MAVWMIRSCYLLVALACSSLVTNGNAFHPSGFVTVPRHNLATTAAAVTALYATTEPSITDDGVHPAVAGWPVKYKELAGGSTAASAGPRVLHTEFAVDKAASEELVNSLDVNNWPTWTTADKEKWRVGNQNADKVMPYGELSFVLSGKLEIIPQDTCIPPAIIEVGDFVTFPEGFIASWRVLEELTWKYYLY